MGNKQEVTQKGNAILKHFQKQGKQAGLARKIRRYLLILFWMAFASPMVVIAFLLYNASNGNFGPLPTFEELENPKSNLASGVYSSDGKEIGKYFKENRTNVDYPEISPYMIDALIATEDERYYDHSGIDFEALARAATSMGSSGGASTLTQQLSKLLFTRKRLSKWDRIKQKSKEWIIAARLEKQYTKQEILAMYLNKFDFLYNAVGVKSAARVYFNTTPDSLKMEEAAMLVGMAKNPILYNPKRNPERALKRREVVLKQWLNNEDNETIRTHIDRKAYDSLRQLPITLDYQPVDHQEGIAPYFREILRKEVAGILGSKNKNTGEYLYLNPDTKKPYNVYSDGLKIYTTIDTRMQRYAEWAVEEHLSKELQDSLFYYSRKLRNKPFSDDLEQTQINEILSRGKRQTQRYRILSGKQCASCKRPAAYMSEDKGFHVCSSCQHKSPVKTTSEIDSIFNAPVAMKVFTWKNKEREKDTIMSPMDSIRYYKSYLRAGLMAMDPNSGYVKAWVGGPHFKHFKYDHVKQARRQVGSTFKPFLYATALRDRVISPCEEVIDQTYCIDHIVDDEQKSWCPGNAGANYTYNLTSFKYGLASSMNNITAHVMSRMNPRTVVNLAKDMGISRKSLSAVPAIALGVFDINVFEMVGAYSAFVNKGIHIEPIIITRIEDRFGNLVYDVEPKMTAALDEETAYVTLQMLKGVTSGVRSENWKRSDGNYRTAGTGLRLRGAKTEKRPYVGFRNPIAGKTGTTQNHSDGWFMGCTPDLVTGVWVGAEDRSVRFNDIKFGQGANTALPIWGYFMNKVLEDESIGLSTGDFEAPGVARTIEMDCNKYKLLNDQSSLGPDDTDVDPDNPFDD